MTYEFLKNFHRRMEMVAIVDFIASKATRQLKLREYKIDGSDTVNLVMLTLCFIMEKSLIEEACTKNDITNFLRRLDIEYLKKNIPDNQYMNLADFIIKDCLQNSGVPYYFPTINFEENSEQKINVKLIDDKRIPVGEESVYSYYMTPQGYRFMFNTLEIEDSMQISIEQFKLNLSIQKRNFNAARSNVDSLFNISRTGIQQINYFIKRIKEDIGSTSIEEYEKIFNNTFFSIAEQNQGYSNLYDLIEKVESSIEDSEDFMSGGDIAVEQARDILYIKNKLKQIISEQSNLLLKQQELQKIYNDAVDNILFIGFENRLNFEQHVTKKLEQFPELAFNAIKVLRPLFKPDPSKLFNINKALKEQKITGSDIQPPSNNILMSDSYFSRAESESAIRIREINSKYINMFELICKNTLITPDKQILLSQLTEACVGHYDALVPDFKILTNVLIQLVNAREIDFTAIKSQMSKTVFNPSEAFDIKYCAIELLNRDKIYDSIDKMKISLSRNKTVNIPEKPRSQDGETDITTLTCPDILFSIEVNNFE